MSEPTKLYYELREGPRSNVIGLKLTDLELEHLDELAAANTTSRAELLRWGLYKVLQAHGWEVWSD